MKIITILILMFSLAFSKIYYSKVTPYEIRDISSNVSGVVLYTDEDSIGKKLSDKPYIRIDAELDKQELIYIKDKLLSLKKIIKTNEEILKNTQESLVKKRKNYEKILALKIKSTVEKDREFYNLTSSENQLLNTKKEIQNLKLKIIDLKLREAHLKRSVKDKNLTAKGFVLYSISVKVGQVVGIATPLAKIADVSKAILTIYLDDADVKGAKNKVVYIDGKKTPYKISRILNIADSKNISKYMAQIIIKSPPLFSKLVQIELK